MSYTFFFSDKPNSYRDKTGSPWIYSNWYPSPHINNDFKYFCVEQEMMHQKALLFKDAQIAEQIMKENSPRKIKALGRKVRNFNPKIWDENKYAIVYSACKAKFEQNPSLRQLLLSSNGLLVEASPYDRVWGIGYSANDALRNIDRWGENLLGKVLTELKENAYDDLRLLKVV